MSLQRDTLAVLLALVAVCGAHENERFPPGVPPKQPAQQAQPPASGGQDIRFHDPNEFQGQQQQQPQQPVQQQQPQQPQPNTRGQQGKGAAASHRHGFGGGKGHKMDIQHEKEHMKEHVQEEFLDLDTMTEPQLMATYFRTFDLDKNSRIDGLEMVKAILRMNSEHEEQASATEEDIEEISQEVDEEMKFYDENGDGMITYPEFMRNHKRRIEELNED